MFNKGIYERRKQQERLRKLELQEDEDGGEELWLDADEFNSVRQDFEAFTIVDEGSCSNNNELNNNNGGARISPKKRREIERRNQLAARYYERVGDISPLPHFGDGPSPPRSPTNNNNNNSSTRGGGAFIRRSQSLPGSPLASGRNRQLSPLRSRKAPEDYTVHNHQFRERSPERELVRGGNGWISPSKYVPERERIEKKLQEQPEPFLKQPRYSSPGYNVRNMCHISYSPSSYQLREREKSKEIQPPLRYKHRTEGERVNEAVEKEAPVYTGYVPHKDSFRTEERNKWRTGQGWDKYKPSSPSKGEISKFDYYPIPQFAPPHDPTTYGNIKSALLKPRVFEKELAGEFHSSFVPESMAARPLAKSAELRKLRLSMQKTI